MRFFFLFFWGFLYSFFQHHYSPYTQKIQNIEYSRNKNRNVTKETKIENGNGTSMKNQSSGNK